MSGLRADHHLVVTRGRASPISHDAPEELLARGQARQLDGASDEANPRDRYARGGADAGSVSIGAGHADKATQFAVGEVAHFRFLNLERRPLLDKRDNQESRRARTAIVEEDPPDRNDADLWLRRAGRYDGLQT